MKIIKKSAKCLSQNWMSNKKLTNILGISWFLWTETKAGAFIEYFTSKVNKSFLLACIFHTRWCLQSQSCIFNGPIQATCLNNYSMSEKPRLRV